MKDGIRPRVLVSAFSFAPRQSSEAGIGWATVASLAKEYDVTVVAAGHYAGLFTAEDFAELARRGIRVEFHELATWLWLRRLPNVLHGSRLYYHLWQNQVFGRFQEIVARDHPAFTQHVTWGAGTIYSRLADLAPPFVYGPVGGHELGSAAIAGRFSVVARLNEWLRSRLIRTNQQSEKMRRLATKAALIIAANTETARAFRAMGASQVVILSNAGLYQEEVAGHGPAGQGIAADSAPPQVLFVGRLRSWKGEELALHALARILETPWRLTIAGDGPNRKRCVRLARQLGIADRVTFRGATSRAQSMELFANSQVFLFPSLHDSGGLVVLEAMASGLPVVCLNKGGPGDMITPDCGIAVDVEDWNQTIDALATATQRLLADRPLRQRMGEAGRLRCASLDDWNQRDISLLKAIRESGIRAR